MKSLKKSLAILAIAALPYVSNAEWQAKLFVTTATTNGIPTTDSSMFGVQAARQTARDPPGSPTGINIYQELQGSSIPLAKNYVNTNDIPIFRGVIENSGATPTSMVARAEGLAGNLALITFSDYSRSVTNGIYDLVNGQNVNIKTNTQGYIITERPVFTFADLSNGEANLEAKFYSDGKIPSIPIYGATDLDKPFTNYVGNINYSPSDDNYKGTNNIPLNVKFFKGKM